MTMTKKVGKREREMILIVTRKGGGHEEKEKVTATTSGERRGKGNIGLQRERGEKDTRNHRNIAVKMKKRHKGSTKTEGIKKKSSQEDIRYKISKMLFNMNL